MGVHCLRIIKSSYDYTLGAVSGSTLYLTSLMPPASGAVLSVDLTRDLEPEVSPASCKCQSPGNSVSTYDAASCHMCTVMPLGI